MFNSNRRCEAVEEQSAGLQHSPHFVLQTKPVPFIEGKVQYRTTDNEVKVCIRERQFLYWLDAKVVRRKVWPKRGSQRADLRDRFRGLVDATNIEPALQEVSEVASRTTAG